MCQFLQKSFGFSHQADTFYSLGFTGLLSALFFAPVIEEILFRYSLSKNYKHGNVLLVVWFVIGMIIVGQGLTLYTIITIILLVSCLLNVSVFSLNVSNYFLIKSKNLIFVSHFVLTSLVFCFMHVFYLDQFDINNEKKLFIIAINLLPMSIMAGLMRYKYGLKYSIIYHSANNFGVISLNTLLYNSI